MSAPATTALGVHSEVGTLRTVIVHRPDIAHERLSPTNAQELLFDDVVWVRRARQEHDAFVDLMRERDVEVLLFHDLLAETLKEWMKEMPAAELATKLTGGITAAELPGEIGKLVLRAVPGTYFVLP